MASYSSQLRAVASGLFAPGLEAQGTACDALLSLYMPDPDGDRIVPRVYDDLRQAVRTQGSLCQRLVHLASLPRGSSASEQEGTQGQHVSILVWKVLVKICRHDELQLRQELVGSGELPATLAAALTDLEQCNSKNSVQTLAMKTLEHVYGKTAAEEPPAWVVQFMPVAVRALELCPVSSTGIMQGALQVLWQHTQLPELLPLLPRIAAAVLDRRLYLQHMDSVGILSARALGVVAAEQLRWPALHARIMGTDLSAVVDAAAGAAIGSPWELWQIQTVMNLADHPTFKDCSKDWMVPRITALLYRRDVLVVVVEIIIGLPQLLKARPDLAEPLVAKGLLPAMARCMVAYEPVTLVSSQLAAILVVLADMAPASLGVAVQESHAMKVAMQHTFGISSLAPYLRQHATAARPAPLPRLQLMRESTVREPAEAAAQAKQLQELRMCSYAGCCRVEDIGGRSLRACSQCVERRHASGSSSRDARAKVAVYCGRECQLADRFAGHAACVLESVKGVTAATMTVQQRKHLLKLLGNPDNAAMLATLRTLRRLFGADITLATLMTSHSTPQHTSMCADWVDEGLGQRLVACLLSLERRRSLQRGSDGVSFTDNTVVLVEALMPVLANVLFRLFISSAAASSSNAHSSSHLLQQQLCADGAPWLAFVLAELGAWHAENRCYPKLMELAIRLSVALVQMCEDGSAVGAARAAAVRATVGKAATPAVLDAVAVTMVLLERMRAGGGPCGMRSPLPPMYRMLAREPAQMRHAAQHPDFIDALCLLLQLPQQGASDVAMAMFTMDADGAVQLISKLAVEDQGAADALGAVGGRLLPLLYKLLDPPPGRPVPLAPLNGLRSPLVAICALARSAAFRDAIRSNSRWLLQHDIMWPGWSREEREVVASIAAELRQQSAAGEGMAGLAAAIRGLHL